MLSQKFLQYRSKILILIAHLYTNNDEYKDSDGSLLVFSQSPVE